MAKQRNSLGIIVLDATIDVFESGGVDGLTLAQYEEKTGIDLKNLFTYDEGDDANVLKTCTKLVLGKFMGAGSEKVVTPIKLANNHGQLIITSLYDLGNGDFIMSSLIVDFSTGLVYFGKV